MRFWSDPELREYQEVLAWFLSQGPRVGTDDRSHYVSAWFDLVDRVAGLTDLFTEYQLWERVQHILSTAFSALSNEQAEQQVRRLRALPAQLDALVKRVGQLPAEPGTRLWNALTYPARDDLAALLKVYAQTLADGGSRLDAVRAFRRAWRRGLQPGDVIAVEDAPKDLDLEIKGRRFRIGVSSDPVEALHLGHRMRQRGSDTVSCLDCVDGRWGSQAQNYVMHPRIAVVYLWELERPNSADEASPPVARVAVMLTDDGIVPLSDLYRAEEAASSVDGIAASAFLSYLKRWAESAQRALVVPIVPHTDWLIAPPGARRTERTVVLPAGGGVEWLLTDLAGTQRLPHQRRYPVWYWQPGRGAAVGVGPGLDSRQGAAPAPREPGPDGAVGSHPLG